MVCVAQQPEQAVNWAQLREAVASQKLMKRDVKVRLSPGDEVKTTLRAVDETALVVDGNRQTKKRWKAAYNNEVRIPRAEVTGLEFQGKKGKKGLMGALIGLGAGVGIALAILANSEEWDSLYSVFLIPAGPVAGYVIGHAADTPLPNYRIVP